MKLTKSMHAWGSEVFAQTFREEIKQLDRAVLPLQQGLTQSSYVSDSEFDVVLLSVDESHDQLRVKTAIMYSGIIAGSCCADDPTPLCEQNEYCELLFVIDKSTAQASVVLL